MKQWEYKLLVIKDEYSYAPMEQMGRDGWELVAVLPETSKRWMTLYFKRQINFGGGMHDR